jgi:hypothetical protein
MAGALYLNWGLASLVIGMLVNGILLAAVWSGIRADMLINPAAATAALMLYTEAGRSFASAADANIAFYVTFGIFYLPVLFATRAVFRRRNA